MAAEVVTMKAVEFPTMCDPDGTLRVPEAVANDIPKGQPLRVLVLIPETEADQQWEQLAALEFGQGYAQSDAIYDQLSGR
jgi:hypothetical protein